jgi:long-chain fatty acid transport protein
MQTQHHGLGAGASWMALVSCLWARTASADPTHHNQVLVGGRALGMGGAATGLADDAGSVYYNPAGLAMLPGSSASASFQLRAIEKVQVGEALNDASLGDLKYSGSPTRAVYASAIAKVGEKDASGFRRHALALSVIHPNQQVLSFSGSTAEGGDFADASIQRDDDTTWTGASYAYTPSDRWAFGLSLFWSQRQYAQREALLSAREVVERPYVDASGQAQSAFGPEQLVGSIRRMSLSAHSLVARIGLRHDFDEHFRFGLMLQPPGVELSASATVAEARTTQNFDAPGAPFSTYYNSSQKTAASSPIPWEVRIGGAYESETFTLDLDVMVHGPSGSESSPIIAAAPPPVDPYFGTAPRFPFFFAPEYYTKLTVNAALGVEGLLARVVPWSVGVFTDRSAAPDVPQASDRYQLEHVDRYGITASVGYRDTGYDVMIGGAYITGSGNALAPDVETAGYTVSDWSERTIVFFLSGQLSALKRAAQDVTGIGKPDAE